MITVRLNFKLDGSTKEWIKTLALQESLWQAKQQSISLLLGQQIENHIRNSGFTHLSHFAKMSEISQTTLQKIILGKSSPRLSTMKRIADVLGMPVNELLTIPKNAKVNRNIECDIIDVTLEFPIGSSIPQWLVDAINSKGGK